MASAKIDADTFKCPICLEIFQKPTKIDCGHTFCESCLSPFLPYASPKCPLCRVEFDPKARRKAKEVEKNMSSTKTTCSGCDKKLSFSKLRSHVSSCSKVDKSFHPAPFQPVGSSSVSAPSNVPNRSTFQCPYCGQKNLDVSDLRRHCNEQHRKNKAAVVCPVCASMPYGDPTYRSANFISHLNLRHQFELDTFVDFAESEENILKKVLAASLEDR